eukprot:COSAG06_NODE_29258_length_559_cov_7.769565_1_plen_122_part_10
MESGSGKTRTGEVKAAELPDNSAGPLHDSVLKQNHVAARVTQLLHDSLRSWGDFQNACFLRFVSHRFCLQSLSLVILLRSPFASSPSLATYSLLVPHSFSIPSFVCNLGKFSNSIPLLMIFD